MLFSFCSFLRERREKVGGGKVGGGEGERMKGKKMQEKARRCFRAEERFGGE